MLKGVNSKLRIIYSVEASIEYESAAKLFSDSHKLKKVILHGPFLKNPIKYLLYQNAVKKEEDFR